MKGTPLCLKGATHFHTVNLHWPFIIFFCLLLKLTFSFPLFGYMLRWISWNVFLVLQGSTPLTASRGLVCMCQEKRALMRLNITTFFHSNKLSWVHRISPLWNTEIVLHTRRSFAAIMKDSWMDAYEVFAKKMLKTERYFITSFRAQIR